MGFDELAGDDLVAWLGSWVDKVAGTVEIQRPPAASVGTVTVSVRGELQQLNLSPEAAGVIPEALSRAIERAYADAYVEALRQLDMVFARIAADVSGDAVLAARAKELRAVRGFGGVEETDPAAGPGGQASQCRCGWSGMGSSSRPFAAWTVAQVLDSAPSSNTSWANHTPNAPLRTPTHEMESRFRSSHSPLESRGNLPFVAAGLKLWGDSTGGWQMGHAAQPSAASDANPRRAY